MTSQSSIIDSINDMLLEAYNSRGRNLEFSIDLAKKALKLSRKIKEDLYIGRSLCKLSLFYMIQGKNEESLNFARQSIKKFEKQKFAKGIADAKYNIGSIHYKTDNPHLGLVNLVDSLEIYKKLADHHNIAKVQKSLGTVYEHFGDYKNAINSYKSAVNASKKANDINLESNTYNNLSGIYLKEKKLELANQLIEKSIYIKELSGDKRGLAFAVYGKAKILFHYKKYKEARKMFQESLDIHQSFGERLGAAMCYRKMAALAIDTNKYDEARDLLKKGLKLCEDYKISLVKYKVQYLLYELYNKENKTKLALKYLEEYILNKESVINAQSLQIIENYDLLKRMELMKSETKLRKAKTKILEKKNRAVHAANVKQEFLSTMSHEIRTPLNAIITISSLLDGSTQSRDHQLIDALRKASNNLLLLINDVLDFTRIETGKLNLELVPSDIYTLFSNLHKTYLNNALEKKIKLELDFDERLKSFYLVDEIRLGQIITNLVNNSLKFTDKGSVCIKVERRKSTLETDTILVSVKDSGIGIPKDLKEEIFESFYQPYSITTRKQGGSGLGLSIVKKLVELYDSKIYVESEEGKGSTFSFELTLTKSSIQPLVNTDIMDHLTNKTVLLAEDNPINAMVNTQLLKKWNMKTELAKNGLEAVKLAKNFQFDYILMDIHMPEMDGFEATRQIRTKTNPNKKTPIFALTADITAEGKKEYFHLFNGFLRKPVEIEKLYNSFRVSM